MTGEKDTSTSSKGESERTDYVYIITHPAHQGWIKIGRSVNPDARLRTYNIGCPQRAYELVYYRPVKNPASFEWYFSENFPGRFEWFQASIPAAVAAIDVLANLEEMGVHLPNGRSNNLGLPRYLYRVVDEHGHEKIYNSSQRVAEAIGVNRETIKNKFYKEDSERPGSVPVSIGPFIIKRELCT